MAKTALVMSLGSSELPQCISVVWKVRDVTPLQVSAKAALHHFLFGRLFFFFFLACEERFGKFSQAQVR